MRIRTQFIITMVLFGVIMVVIAASAIIMHQKLEKTSQQENLAANIAQGANELSYLANDYLIYRESQQLKRWQSRLASFSNQVAGLRADRPEQQALVANIKANEQRLKQVFDSVASVVRAPSKKRNSAPDLAFLQVSWSRIAVQSQGLVSDASRLSQLLHQEMDRLTEVRTVLIYVMVGIFGALLLVSYMLTYRHILKSIVTLQAGAAVIGSGDLDFKITEKKNDEIGDLSHAFNQMTADLKAVTASKTDLEREVSQRKQAEEQLRQQREWLRVTLSSIGDAVIACDIEGRITFLNPVAVTLTGWQREEAMHQPITSVFQIINEKTRQSAEDLVTRVTSEKRIVALANDTALVTRDGREVPIEDSAAPIKDAAGNVTGVVLVFHDVTERRHTQEALRRSEARYRSYIEVTEQLGWTTNNNGEVAEDIPSWRRFTGQTEEQVKGWGWSEALHPDDLEETARVWRNAVATKSRYETEYRIRRYDAVYRHFLAVGVPVFKDNGDILEWVGTCIDITGRKQAEEKIRETHERAVWLGRFPEQNPNPVMRASAEGTILYCNPASSTLPGWRCEVGQIVQNELSPLFGRAMSEGKELENDIEIGGRIYSIWITSFPEERYSNLYGRDITERKRAEEALRQRTLELQQLTESLEQRVQERTEQLGVMNERLRNQIEECARVETDLRKTQSDLRQLSMALLNAQERERKLIAQEIHDSMGASLAATKFKVESALKEMGNDIPQASAALESIIPIIQETIEEARRIQMSLRPSMLDDIGILATISWFCRQFEATYSKIRIQKEIDIEEQEVRDSLKIVIFRVLQEALNNIAKHSKTPVVLLSLGKTDQAIELVIRDSGQGFDLSEAQSRRGGSRGLGLDSMRERTELSGGSFSIESNKGKGTEIRASWPL